MKTLLSIKGVVVLMAVVALSMWVGYGLNTGTHETDGREGSLLLRNNPLATSQELLYVCPMMWRIIDNFSSGSVCLVLASNHYDENDYYRDYNEYLRALRSESR